MSKLLSAYQNLKKQNNEIVYLFKVGLFYNFLNDDAITMSNVLHLKISNLSSSIVKCGFPCNAFEKYIKLLSSLPYKIKIIDSLENNTIFELKDFELNQKIKDFLKKIASIDIDDISVAEAYSLLESLQQEANNLL